jgi:hypothetical protein
VRSGDLRDVPHWLQGFVWAPHAVERTSWVGIPASFSDEQEHSSLQELGDSTDISGLTGLTVRADLSGLTHPS